MKTEVVKGQTVKIESTIYSDLEGLVVADITAADITVLVKKAVTDTDAQAIIMKTTGLGVTIVSGPAGRCDTIISALELNSLNYTTLYYEILVNLSTGAYIRSGVETLVLKPNLIKNLN